MSREVAKAILFGVASTAILAVLIVIGSRNLSQFDAALVAYTFAVVFATFGLTYRYAMWLQRPPTAIYWKRGWQVFVKRGHRAFNVVNWFNWVFNDFVLNRFIWARGRMRGLSHALIMWGCIIAVSITFPLVFGWLHFASVPGKIDWYRIIIFGFPTFAFPTASVLGFLIFHGLVWSSFLVIGGVMLVMRRRMREEGAAALQLFAEDFMPLILLFAVSLTGLMLMASYTWMKGYGYDFLAILHAITVILTFLWMPFGKFFHIFQRPAQIGMRFYKDVGAREAPARCGRCNHPFSSQMHVRDLIQVEQKLGYRYSLENGAVDHYQWICPPCRRALFALSQAKLWRAKRGGTALTGEDGAFAAMPVHVNPAMGAGPLGEDDRRNFHP